MNLRMMKWNQAAGKDPLQLAADTEAVHTAAAQTVADPQERTEPLQDSGRKPDH